MRPLAVNIFSHKSGHQELLERQLAKAGIPLLNVTMRNFSWRRRMEMSRDIADAYKTNLLIFLDAWDTILMGTLREIEDLKLEDGVTFAAQKTCWPFPDREPEYPKVDSKWRFINSNPMAGIGANIFNALSWGWDRFPIIHDTAKIHDYEHVCERFLTDLYLSEARDLFNIKLDTKCQLVQVFRKSEDGELYYDGSRIVNTAHGTKPIFLHANGRTVIPQMVLNGCAV